MVDTLLEQWREYLESSEYKRERDRARKGRTDENKQSEENAQLKVHSLKHQRRCCQALSRTLAENTIREVPRYQQYMYERFEDGRLDKEIDEATRIHGYGKLSTG